MEKNIYDRQINKQGISDRVVDELNPQNLLSRKQVDILMRYEVSSSLLHELKFFQNFTVFIFVAQNVGYFREPVQVYVLYYLYMY